MNPSTLLDRILWTQLARVLPGTPPEWDAESASARAMRRVLDGRELDSEEAAIVARWDAERDSSRKLFDRLLQARVNRAVLEGVRVEARRLGLTDIPRVPRVLVVREGGLEEPGRSLEGRQKTVVEFLADAGADVAELAPGAKLDELVDLLVLANQDGAEALRGTLGPTASVVRAADGDASLAHIDLLLAGPTPSIQVFDIERDLARLEELLRNAIPPEKRPAKGGSSWSFGQDLTGELLGGKYRVRGLKGKGAFKTVYEGEDEMLGARVAVAVLNPKGARSPRALEHFQDEAKKLTTIDHENIVRWITFDRTGEGLNYFVMEYLDGEELEVVLRREGRLAPKRVAAILFQVVAALRRAHGGGKHGALLHLDLKPENVFVLPALVPGEPERVKVIDFGIGQNVGAEVRAAERPELRTLYDLPAEELGKSIGSIALPEDDEEQNDEPEAEPDAADARTPARRRVQRARGGTLLYASPEQCKHLAGHKDIEALDGRSDLYSLGVMAFRMLTGQYPFARITTAYEAIQNHLEVAPRKVGSLGIHVPRELAAFVDRCLVKERAKRWRDANEAYEALRRIVQPRRSALKVSAPFVLVGALGLGALYYTREPVANALRLVDPAIASVSEGVRSELFLGPASPTRTLRLESEVPWSEASPPALSLLDAGSGAPLPGWSAHWSGAAPRELELTRLDGAQSAAAVLELVPAGGFGARRSLWRSGRLALHHLGPWRIERARASGAEGASRLDPRGRRLELELAGEAEGRAALESIELWLGSERLALAPAGAPQLESERARYAGPALDALFSGAPRELELRVVARDRAGQQEETALVLSLAGEPADFAAECGFVARAEGGSALLPAASETLLLPENALCLAADAPARARLFLEPARAPALEVLLPSPGTARFVSLAELGIAAAAEHAGALRIELDDAPYAARLASAARTRVLAFRFAPVAPELAGQLVSTDGVELELRAGESESNPVRVDESAQLFVRTPPGSTNLWVEAEWGREGAAPSAPSRLRRTTGPFELKLALPEEGAYRVTVHKYVLLADDKRGPLIPPAQVFRFELDRSAPVLELALEGSATTAGDEPLFVFEDGREPVQRVRVRARDAGLASLRWELVGPGGVRAGAALALSGALAEELELPSLLAYQAAEGRYELALLAADAAGNTTRVSRAWQVARVGPTLTLLEPLASGEERRWALGSARAWNVRVRATDANGVAAVRVRVVYRGEAGAELALVPAGGELWELPERDRPTAHPWWTNKELALELVAVDRAGLATPKSERGLVPEIPYTGPLVITPRASSAANPGAVPAAAMIEVPAGVEYVFGGKSGEGRQPWIVPIPRGALRPYYLDAREVSRGEFLAFLESAEGFMNPRGWPAGSAPDAARAAELARRFSTEPAQPATGVSWAEATAYAAWRGKRLPTLLEWEFAVRGPEYREAPPDTRPPGAPADWPANLCTGAREWTATPEDLVAEALDFASQCKRHPERLLAPVPGAPEAAQASSPLEAPAAPGDAHWVVGGGAGASPSWSARSLRPGEDVGFRCAIDQESAHSWLDRGNYVAAE